MQVAGDLSRRSSAHFAEARPGHTNIQAAKGSIASKLEETRGALVALGWERRELEQSKSRETMTVQEARKKCEEMTAALAPYAEIVPRWLRSAELDEFHRGSHPAGLTAASAMPLEEFSPEGPTVHGFVCKTQV